DGSPRRPFDDAARSDERYGYVAGEALQVLLRDGDEQPLEALRRHRERLLRKVGRDADDAEERELHVEAPRELGCVRKDARRALRRIEGDEDDAVREHHDATFAFEDCKERSASAWSALVVVRMPTSRPLSITSAAPSLPSAMPRAASAIEVSGPTTS